MIIVDDRVHERVAALAHGRRMSQLDLAARAGTTQRHVSFIEQGRSRPGRGMVVRLAALGLAGTPASRESAGKGSAA